MPHMAWAVIIRQDDDKVLPSVSSSIYMNVHTRAHAGKNSTHMGLHAYATCVDTGISNACAPMWTRGHSGIRNTHAPS